MSIAGDVPLALLRVLAAAGATTTKIALQLKVSRDDVRRIAGEHGIEIHTAPRISDDAVPQIRALAGDGAIAVEIARQLGMPLYHVLKLAQRHGITIRKLTPAERAARGQAASGKVACRPPPPAPKWVPADLRGDYRDMARDLGPAYAASAIRRLMEEAR